MICIKFDITRNKEMQVFLKKREFVYSVIYQQKEGNVNPASFIG